MYPILICRMAVARKILTSLMRMLTHHMQLFWFHGTWLQATRIVPGSHRWPQHRVPLESEVVYAEMQVGSVVFISGMTYHSAGGNSTDTPRLGMNLDFNAGFIAEEEIQVLSVSDMLLSCCPENADDSSAKSIVHPSWSIVFA